VMDDDSSLENILQWDTEAAIAEGKLLLWPRTPAGERKTTRVDYLCHTRSGRS
jgi:hypothetical protein